MRINGKHVVDATKPLRIEISKRDAALGKTKDPGACAAARAIIRTIADVKSARVHLGRTYVEHPDRWVRYKTPTALKVEIVSFDRGAHAEYTEGMYTLYVPSPTDKIGARRGRGASMTSGKERRAHIARVHHQIEGVRAKGGNR